ncbi:hypothetical protein FOZ62_014658, partial [Perkinsus olseni]
RIKLADFGLAKSYMHPTHRCTHEIVTLWYRAPEVIMGSLDYTYSIDVWSIGCVMAELFTGGSPLFPTDSEVETLFQIFRMRGTPTPETWPGIVETCPDYCELWPKWKEDRGLQTMQQRNPEVGTLTLEASDSLHWCCAVIDSRLVERVSVVLSTSDPDG